MTWFPQDVSESGYWVDRLFYLGFWLTSITFLLVVGILIYFVLRYRSREGRKAYYTHGNSRQAFLLTLSLALLVFVVIDVNLAIHDHFAWEAIWGESKEHEDPIRVQIMPEQFAWNIRYAGPDSQFGTDDDIVTINDLHIPVNRRVNIALKSKDVIHSFFVPNFRVKQDALPGMVTHISLHAKKNGKFDIACAEHCGLGHYRMRGSLTVQTQQEFESWLLDPNGKQAGAQNWGWEWGVLK